MDHDFVVEALTEENTQLRVKLALHFLDATEEDKQAAEILFEEQRDEIAVLRIENDALRKSRDQFQLENARLKRRVLTLEKQIKG